MIHHHLKIHPDYFQTVIDGRKPFEIRYNDRDFKPGDKCSLEEYVGKKEYPECPDIYSCAARHQADYYNDGQVECPLGRRQCTGYYEDIYTGSDCLIKIKEVFPLDKAGLPGYVAFTFELLNVRDKKCQ